MDERRLHPTLRALTDTEQLYVPELVPVTERTRELPLMTRPWLDWARRVTGLLKGGGSGGGGGHGGDVVGPAGATADAIAVYSGTTGKLIKDSLKTIANVISEAVSAAVAAILPGGTLPAGNLPATVVFEDQANTFTADQTIQAALHVDGNLHTDGDLSVAADAQVYGMLIAEAGLGYTPLDAAQLLAGTVPDARLAANIQRKPIAAADLPAHAPRHQLGGADPIRLDDLATPDDNTDLDVSTLRHGLTPKLTNNPLHYLNGQGAWAAASGSGLGDVTGPASATDNDIAVFNGATGKILKSVGLTYALLARKDSPNFYSSYQQIDATTPAMVLNDISQAANQRFFQFRNSGAAFRIWAQNDVGGMVSETVIDRAANLYVGGAIAERGRASYLGEWIAVPYSAANFTAVGGTWTVEADDVLLNSYTVIGKTLIWMVSLVGTTMSTASRALINLPGGFSGTVAPAPTAWVSLGSALNTTGVTIESENATQLKIWRDRGGSGFGSGTNNFTFLFTAIVALT